MAIVYTTSQTKPFNQMQGYTSLGGQYEEFSVTIPATVGFANGDSVVLAALPLNATLLMFYISTPALDTGAGITVEIGDTVDLDRYVASTSTSFQSAVDAFANALNGYVANSLPHTYTTQTTLKTPGDITAGTLGVINPPVSSTNVADWLVMTITHSNTTPAVAGTFKGYIAYTLNTNVAP